MTESLTRLFLIARSQSRPTRANVDQGMVGKELAGKYKLLEILGTGATADVYKAVDIILERVVAIKVLRNLDEDVRQRFFREMRIHGSLEHGNIVQALDCFEHEGEACFVLEYLDGVSLEQIIKEADGPLDADDAIYVFDRVCGALSYAHRRGIIHRDLKPSNIVLSMKDDRVEVKVVDFGLAKANDHMQKITTTGLVVGSPLFMSPEQCLGYGLDYRSDIYSLAMVGYILISGQLPYDVSTVDQVMRAHTSPEIQPRPLKNLAQEFGLDIKLPVRLYKVLCRAMEVAPDRRYESVEQFRKAMQAWHHLVTHGAADDRDSVEEEVFQLNQIENSETANTASPPAVGLSEIWDMPQLVASDGDGGWSNLRLENIVLSQEATGQVLNNKYQLLDILGQGGMSVVYRARKIDSGELVAAKTLKLANLNVSDRFLREIRVHSAIKHPNIVKAVDHFKTDLGQVYFVMELLDGKTLQQFIQGQREFELQDSLAMRCSIVGQILDALEYAHDQSVIHRDLKPDNIMLVESAGTLRVKVLDFGLAKIQDDLQRLTSTGVLIGTPAYMSPEHCLGGKIGPRSDLYSLGILAYELFTGSLPYTCNNDLEYVTAHCDPAIKPRSLFEQSSEIPAAEALESILFKALCLMPEERFASAAEMKEAFSDWWAETGRSEPSPFRMVRRRTQRRALTESAALDKANAGAGESEDLESLVSHFRNEQVRSFVKSRQAPADLSRLYGVFKGLGLVVVVGILGLILFYAYAKISDGLAVRKAEEAKLTLEKARLAGQKARIEAEKAAQEKEVPSSSVYGEKPTARSEIIKFNSRR